MHKLGVPGDLSWKQCSVTEGKISFECPKCKETHRLQTILFSSQSAKPAEGLMPTSEYIICDNKNVGILFLTFVVEKTEKLKVGNGLEPSTDINPLNNRFQLDVVLKHIEGAKNKKTMKKFLRRGGIFRCPKYGIFKIIQDLDFLLMKINQ